MTTDNTHFSAAGYPASNPDDRHADTLGAREMRLRRHARQRGLYAQKDRTTGLWYFDDLRAVGVQHAGMTLEDAEVFLEDHR